MSSLSFCFTGGGTGGHVSPNLAIAEAIRARYPDAPFLYVGVRGKAESSMVPRAWEPELASGKARLRYVRSQGYPGMGLRAIPFAISLALGVSWAMLLLLSARPTVIVATGGYASAPILLAAFVLRRLRLLPARIFVHEQNAVLGRMNRLAVRFADQVGVAFPETQVPPDKKVYVGYPVRASAVAGDGAGAHTLKATFREKHGIPASAKVVFAFGGSQGARTINRGLVDALPLLLADPDVWVIHGTGKQLSGNAYNGYNDAKKRLAALSGLPADAERRYLPKDFFHDMREFYAVADVVICRGGAGSLNEVCANGVPAVVIPKANLPGDHQAQNARSMERRDAAVVVYERVDVASGDSVESVDPEELATLIQGLLDDPQHREAMSVAGLAQYNPQTTALCAQLVAAMLGADSAPELPEPAQAAPERILGQDSGGLLRVLQQARAGTLQLTEEERRLALYKVDGYLASGGYVLPARGCRMVGYGGYAERVDVLIHHAAAKRDGGDYRKMPITRRDAFTGLALLGVCNAAVADCLEAGLSDPYFEARKEAIDAVAALGKADPAPLRRLLPALVRLSRHRAFDTRQAALRALAELAERFEDVRGAFQARRYDPNWKVREALLRGLARMVARGLLPAEEAAREGNEVLRTSDGYRASFPIKEAFRDLPGRDALRQEV